MRNFTFNCKGKLLVINSPVVMGILNVTPDSFFDGGKYTEEKSILLQAEKMLREGAAILDIGAMSSRPGAELISEAEELQRLIPVVKNIHTHFPDAIISVDTFRSKVTQAAIENGASIINDISGGLEDERIFEVAAHYHCPLILMHRRGNFETMHQLETHKNSITELVDYFLIQIEKAKAAGVKDIIIDPGFGFSKTLEENYALLNNLNALQLLDKAILVGLSRKSMLCRLLNIEPANALNATTAAHMVALERGAAILRAHDVKEAMECIRVYSQL